VRIPIIKRGLAWCLFKREIAVNPYRGEAKSTQASKGRSLGVTVAFMPDRASKLSGTPNSQTAAPPPDQHKPQFPEDQRGPGYENDAHGWVRGAGESGEGKPGFDHSKKSG
jgi:hypothetical protein